MPSSLDDIPVFPAVAAIVGGVGVAWFWRSKSSTPSETGEATSAVSDPPKNSTYKTIRENQKVRYTDESTAASSPAKPLPTLVMVHGFGGCLETWNLVKQPLLEMGFRVVTLDLLGDGFSDKPLDGSLDYTLRGQGRALVEFIKEMGMLDKTKSNKLVLVAHSSGAIVATAAAKDLYECDTSTLQGLVLVAPGFFQVKPKLFSYPVISWLGKYLARLFLKSRISMLQKSHVNSDNLSDDLIAAFDAASKAPNTGAALERFITSIEPEYVQVLEDLREETPIHVVWSKEDKVNPFAAQKMEELIQQEKLKAPFTFRLLSGSGHYIQHEMPDSLAKEIETFCKRLDKQSKTK